MVEKKQKINKKLQYMSGKNPEGEARFTAFLIENHLDYATQPEQVATPEQIRFIVYTNENQRYFPCSDKMFYSIMNQDTYSDQDSDKDFGLLDKYKEVLAEISFLIYTKIEDDWEKKFLKSLINIKFIHETRDQMMIPSRLKKRLYKIFLDRSQIEDPFFEEKSLSNRRACSLLNSKIFKQAMDSLDVTESFLKSKTISSTIKDIEKLELIRLFSISVEKDIWNFDKPKNYSKKDFLNLFKTNIAGNGLQPLIDFLSVSLQRAALTQNERKKILWLANEAGEIIIDLAIINYLTVLGHKVIIAFKDGPCFTKVDLADAQNDEILKKELKNTLLITQKDITKNDLKKILQKDYNIFAISDGTREDLNFLLTSTTFARIFKEVDGVISKGEDQKRRFFDTSFQFTQDIFNISKSKDGKTVVSHKPKHPDVIKFAYKSLEIKAQKIIEEMKNAKEKGMAVIFYSGIIGSIPGKIDIAKKIMTVFIQHLMKQSDKTFIINPSEHFEAGMDADDLMYMWEIVQTSGYIEIWRFQTYTDISTAFSLLNKKVPPEWVGKDATFSTGCTKEMEIALQVQKKHPEMQIIGPSKEKFSRRKEYGIGKMYDRMYDEKK